MSTRPPGATLIRIDDLDDTGAARGEVPPGLSDAVRTASSSAAPARMPYVAAVDGLRAIAVLAVLAYHLGVSWLPGGFLGVEVFFAVSGFLITALLVGELGTAGRIDFRRFYRRRAQRLLPTLAITIVGVAGWVALFDRDELARFGHESLAAAGYVSNWFLIVAERSYFEAFGRPSPLLHLWSLAIEEQFYLLWPVALAALVTRIGHRRTLVLTLVGMAASTLIIVVAYDPLQDPSRVYYGTDTRAAGLLLGAALALAWRPWERTIRLRTAYRLSTLGVLALIGLAWALANLGELEPATYRPGLLVVSALTLVVVAAVVTPGAWLGRLLGAEPLRQLGLRSYALYLVHWPVVVYTRPGPDLDASWAEALVVRLLIIVVLTEVVHRLVELPLRRARLRPAIFGGGARRSLSRTSVRWAVPAAVAVAGTAAVASMAIALTRASDVDPSEPSQVIASIGTAVADAGPGADGDGAGPTGSYAADAGARAPDADPGPSVGRIDGLPAPAPAPGSTTDEGEPVPPGGVAQAAEGAPPDPPSAEPTPTARAAPAEAPGGPSVLVIGDSVALGAAADIAERLGGDVVVDAVVGRQLGHAVEVLEAYRSAGVDADTVVVHLGTNGPFADDDLDALVAVAGPGADLVLVTAHVPRPWEAQVNEALRSALERHPDLQLLDWHALAGQDPGWLGSDDTHLTPAGADAYADVLVGALGDRSTGPAG